MKLSGRCCLMLKTDYAVPLLLFCLVSDVASCSNAISTSLSEDCMQVKLNSPESIQFTFSNGCPWDSVLILVSAFGEIDPKRRTVCQFTVTRGEGGSDKDYCYCNVSQTCTLKRPIRDITEIGIIEFNFYVEKKKTSSVSFNISFCDEPITSTGYSVDVTTATSLFNDGENQHSDGTRNNLKLEKHNEGISVITKSTTVIIASVFSIAFIIVLATTVNTCCLQKGMKDLQKRSLLAKLSDFRKSWRFSKPFDGSLPVTYRGSNVSISITNDLYKGSAKKSVTHGGTAGGGDDKRDDSQLSHMEMGEQENDYAKISDLARISNYTSPQINLDDLFPPPLPHLTRDVNDF